MLGRRKCGKVKHLEHLEVRTVVATRTGAFWQNRLPEDHPQTERQRRPHSPLHKGGGDDALRENWR